ncbi:MAG: hypothetical protein AAF328_08590 [Planctomycetota bacterium]
MDLASCLASVSLSCFMVVVLTAFASAEHNEHPIAQYDGYELVWNDEFDIDGLPDPTKWRFEREGFIRNNEDQWYQDDNATV